MIERYRQAGTGYAAYGLDFDHKHIKEIKAWSGLSSRPILQPAVGDYAQGMLVFIPLNDIDSEPLQQALADYYAGQQFIKVNP